MTAPASIARAVVRAYVRSVVFAAAAIVVVGSAVAAGIVVQRDDVAARALARTLAAELINHAGESRLAQDELVRHELEEQRWFARRIEVWRGDDRIGGATRDAAFADWARAKPGCVSARVTSEWQRVCVVQVGPNLTIVVGSSLAPMLGALGPFVLAVALAAFAVALLFALLSRRVVQRGLEPLVRFERHMASLPALGRERRVTDAWGATEIDVLAQTFNALLERIDTAVEREQRFVADAAHELRTPLTRLRGQLELVLGLIDAPGEAVERLSLAVRTCEELSGTTEALLALARDETSATDAVDLGEVVQSVCASLDAESRGRVRCILGHDVEAIVRGDQALLALAAANLVDNALKYTTEAVMVSVTVEGDLRSVVVEDSGDGIPADDLLLVRQRFVRGRVRPTTARGTGLGLALVDHVAHMHRGLLLLSSRSPHGLRAELRLPAWSPNEPTKPSEASPISPPG